VVGERGLAVVEQHGQQLINMFVLGRKASTHHVIAACHQLHQLASDVGMRQTGREKDCVTALQAQDVEKVNGENAYVSTILRMEIENERVPRGSTAAAAAQPFDQSIHIFFHKRGACSHKGRVQAPHYAFRVWVAEAHTREGCVVRYTVALVAAIVSCRHVSAALLSISGELAHKRVAQRATNDFAELGDIGWGGGAQKVVELDEGPEATHGKSGRHGQRKLWLVVSVLVVLWEFFVEVGSALLCRMRLNAEGVAYGENL
jgi:hypothetical protein